MVRIIRDEQKSVPTAMFTPRNIVKSSLSIQYIMPSDETADSVSVEYFSSKYWKQDEVLTKLDDATEDNPAKVSLFGCTEKAQAIREGKYICACNRYRRKMITFKTELEGLIPTYGDLIAIAHDMPNWGQGGEVIAVSGSSLTLSEPLVWSEGEPHYIALRNSTGGVAGTYEVTQGNSDNEVVLATAPTNPIYTGTSQERTHFAFGVADKRPASLDYAATLRLSNTSPRRSVSEDGWNGYNFCRKFLVPAFGWFFYGWAS
jgi:predicted phage tail protein